MTEFSRRALIIGATATAATAAFGTVLISPTSLIAKPSPDDAVSSDKNLTNFANLSAALTGVDVSILTPNVDPFGLNAEISRRANAANAGKLQTILDKFTGGKTIEQILAEEGKDEAAKFLMRSIILAWYLGAWYAPDDLKKNSYKPRNNYNSTRRYSQEVLIRPSEIISPDAYTNGLVWRVAQAHPMGYSNLQFGYWEKDPPGIEKFIKPLKADNPKPTPATTDSTKAVPK
jgi:Membrane bound FAD containing D-sorbitol dehydrogenase